MTVCNMIDMGSCWVFPIDIVAIEKGRWNDTAQDWTAILVSNGGARIPTDLMMKTVKSNLEFERTLAQKG